MTWTTRLGRLAGIDVYMHWTFLLLLLWIAISYLASGEPLAVAIEGVFFVCLLFGCVVLHELGHALTARRYGIPTRDITLLPIGGVARLERMPEDPRQELAVALAGPAVNVVIATLLYFALNLVYGYTGQLPTQMVGGNLAVKLMWVNVALVVFNLLPAFPMDGGRVLRALLATRMDYVRATNIAASVGQAMALLFALLGLFGNPFLIFIALFVYLGAAGEASATQSKVVLRDIAAHEAMMTKYRSFPPTATLQQLVDELLAGHQDVFPIEDQGRFVGLVNRPSLISALQQGGAGQPVTAALADDVLTATRNQRLDTLARDMQERGLTNAAVVDDGRLVGIVSATNVGELLLVRSALADGATIDSRDEAAKRLAGNLLGTQPKGS